MLTVMHNLQYVMKNEQHIPFGLNIDTINSATGGEK